MTRHLVRVGQSQRETAGVPAFARLQARQQTMPVIEQAKGIIIGQQRCGPDEAFDLLRRISQRTNVQLRVLAARLVEHAASSDHGNVTPITVGPRTYRRSGRWARTPAG
jgi:AmiR/NasT family two-component response regulator